MINHLKACFKIGVWWVVAMLVWYGAVDYPGYIWMAMALYVCHKIEQYSSDESHDWSGFIGYLLVMFMVMVLSGVAIAYVHDHACAQTDCQHTLFHISQW